MATDWIIRYKDIKQSRLVKIKSVSGYTLCEHIWLPNHKPKIYPGYALTKDVGQSVKIESWLENKFAYATKWRQS